MLLKRVPHAETKHVSPQSALDYETFSERFHNSGDRREMTLFEQFIAARRFIREGYETYLDPSLRLDSESSSFRADVCGISGKQIKVAFCTTGTPDRQLWNTIRKVSDSENATALIVTSEEIESDTLEEMVPGAFAKGGLQVETLGWFDDTLETTLRETLRTIELLVNETRMRMLAPLLQKSALKRDFRARINPKLVYHNIDALSKAGLLNERFEGTYELSQVGKTVLAEFIVFLETTRKTLDDLKSEEVKSVGR